MHACVGVCSDAIAICRVLLDQPFFGGGEGRIFEWHCARVVTVTQLHHLFRRCSERCSVGLFLLQAQLTYCVSRWAGLEACDRKVPASLRCSALKRHHVGSLRTRQQSDPHRIVRYHGANSGAQECQDAQGVSGTHLFCQRSHPQS